MKKTMISIVMMVFLSLPVRAQIILTDSDLEHVLRTEQEAPPFVPELGVTYDQYAPLADGTVLLGALCGLYLLKKHKKK